MDMKKSKRNMILYLLGNLTSLMGTNIYSFAMSFFVLNMTGSPVSFSLNIVLSLVPRLILGPVAGVYCDRMDRKRLVIFFDGLSGAVMLSIFALSLTNGLQLWMVYLSTFLLSICNTIFGTAFQASIPNLVNDEHLGKINSFSQSTMSLAHILGPILGGMIYAVVTPSLFLLINGISFLLSTLSEMFIDFKFNIKEVIKDDSKSESLWQGFKEGFRYTRSFRMLYELLKGSLFINFFITAINVGLPVIIVLSMNQSEKTLGFVNAGFAVGMLLFSLLFASKKNIEFNIKSYCGLIGLMGIGIMVMTLPILSGIAFTPWAVVLVYGGLCFIMGGLCVSINIPVMVFMQKIIDDEYRGRVMSIVSTVCSAIVPVGTLLYGFLYEKVAISPILIISGICILFIAGLLFYNMTYKVEKSELEKKMMTMTKEVHEY